MMLLRTHAATAAALRETESLNISPPMPSRDLGKGTRDRS